MRTIAIAKRVVLELLRDKRTLALMFVAPVLILFLMKLVFSANSTTNVQVATVDVASNVRTELNAIKHVTAKKEADMQAAKDALANQKIDAIIHETSANKYTVTYANTDAAKTTVVKQAFKAALAAVGVQQMRQTVTQLSKSVAQLTTTVAKLQPQAAAQSGTTPALQKNASNKITHKYVYGDKDSNFFDKIVPILMGFFVFFFVFLISGMALLKERTTGTLDRLLATPVRRSEIVFGYMISYAVLALVQTIIIVLATVYLLNVEIKGNLLDLMLVNFFLAMVALAFGILMSTFARSEFQMMQFIPIIIVPQIFFSGIIPLDSMADWIQKIALVLPLKYAGDAMTKVVMYGQSTAHLAFDIGILAIFLIVLTFLNIIGLKRYRKV